MQQRSVLAAEERALMADLGMRFVDASTPEADRGFEFLHQWLCNSLLDDGLWRLAWHLRGMAACRLFSHCCVGASAL